MIYLARHPLAIDDLIAFPQTVPRLFSLFGSQAGMYSDPNFMAKQIFRRENPIAYAQLIVNNLLTPAFIQRFAMAKTPVDVFLWDIQLGAQGVENPVEMMVTLLSRINNFDVSRIFETVQ